MTKWQITIVDEFDLENGTYAAERTYDETYDTQYEAQAYADWLNEQSDGSVYAVTWIEGSDAQ